MNDTIREDLKSAGKARRIYHAKQRRCRALCRKSACSENRVRSYFQNTPHSDRITVMISQIARFEYIVCDSEYEALLLENNLIKKYKPKYNVLLKDDKGYPYIKVTLSDGVSARYACKKRPRRTAANISAHITAPGP